MCTECWVHSTSKKWWKHLTVHVSTHFGEILEELGLYQAVRAVQWVLPHSIQNFFCIMELYNAITCTPVGEMGIMVHEMHVVTGSIWRVHPKPLGVQGTWIARFLDKWHLLGSPMSLLHLHGCPREEGKWHYSNVMGEVSIPWFWYRACWWFGSEHKCYHCFSGQ